jgi:density-regulated protein DRP1
LKPITEGEDEEKKDGEKEEEGDKNDKEEGGDKKKDDKKKKKQEKKIIIEQTKRGKKKHITYILGLDKFGLVLKDVAKQLSKKLACSCTVTKEDNGEDSITMTGEFADDVLEFLTTTFPNIEAKNCQVKIDKK